MISAQCSECQNDENSNKRGCGSPAQAQAQASARVDVSTARVFPAWTMESNMSASFCVNAWFCAPQATDRDLESFNVVKKGMLGYVHRGRPTMILHSRKICNICNVCNFYADILFWYWWKSVIFVI